MIGRSRRMFATTVTLACVALTATLVQFFRDRLGDESTFTGWTLLGATIGLYLLTARKKFIQMRLGPVAAWMQVHAYMGTFASIVFLMHIGWPIRGLFETLLAFCFVFVAVTGIVLGVLSRTTPRRLAAIPVDHHWESIPALQAAVAEDAHEVAIESSRQGEGATLAEFYQRRLLPFFRSPRGLVYRALPNGVLRRQLIRELNDLDRYLADSGVQSRESLVQYVQQKDDLDYHMALQERLRFLYAMHVSMTWSLALMIGVHVVLVYRFQGAL